MVFRDSHEFMSADMEQLATLFAKVGHKNFVNLHDVVTNVYTELLERKGILLRLRLFFRSAWWTRTTTTRNLFQQARSR